MKLKVIVTILGLLALAVVVLSVTGELSSKSDKVIVLPETKVDGGISVEKALAERRSIRSFQDQSLNLSQVSQLLWAAQGITGDQGQRTAPSAMALCPLNIYVVAGNVTGGCRAASTAIRPRE